MFNTLHAAAALAILKAIPEPAIALPIAFASHFILDAIPHYGPLNVPSNLKPLFFDFHSKLQNESKPGLASEIIFFCILVAYIFFLT